MILVSVDGVIDIALHVVVALSELGDLLLLAFWPRHSRGQAGELNGHRQSSLYHCNALVNQMRISFQHFLPQSETRVSNHCREPEIVTVRRLAG
jgi:hypothetical protein